MKNIKPYRLKKSDYPKCLRGHSEIKGIYVGGCVTGFEMVSQKQSPYSKNGKVIAHAHITPSFTPGWICIEHKDYLQDENVLLHEAAICA